MADLGAAPRALRPKLGSTIMASLAAVFSEANPAQVSETPRTVSGNFRAAAEPIANAAIAVQYGWIFRPAQTKGMSTLYIDQVRRMPDASISAGKESSIHQSRYVPYNHYRTAWWLYSGWDPIFRYAMTALDMRFQVAHPAPLTNQQPGNLPGGVRMGPYAAPYRVAWRVPRFSTEPNTIIPQSGRP